MKTIRKWAQSLRLRTLTTTLVLAVLAALLLAGSAQAAPGKPTALTPKATSTVATGTPTFKWGKGARAATYEVRVYKGSTLKVKKTGVRRLSWKSGEVLTRGATYTWKVRGRKAGVNGPWSKSLKFTVALILIGDAYQGGVVAYILQPGDPGYVAGQTHGLIAATADQSTIAASTATAGSASVAPPAGWIAWWSGNYMVTGATATELGTGFANTDLIIAAQGAPATDYAAGLARSCNGGGYTDWYLPSRDELNKLFLNKNAIGGFEAAIYWSSSEDDADDAWLQNFVTAEHFWDYKDNACKVRPVRAF